MEMRFGEEPKCQTASPGQLNGILQMARAPGFVNLETRPQRGLPMVASIRVYAGTSPEPLHYT